MSNIAKIQAFLAARVAAGKITQTQADAILAAKAAKIPAGILGLAVTDLNNAQQGKLLQVLAIKAGLADSTGKLQ